MQNVMQLESSYHTNKRKRKASEALKDDFDYLYGIVTTADYHIVLTEDILDNDTKLRQGVKEVMEVIVDLLKDRVEDSDFDSLRELNAKLLVEKAELRKKFAEIKSENVEISEKVKELEQKNTELEARLAIVEQSSVAVDEQSRNDKETIAKQSAPSSCIYSNVEIKVEAESTEKCFAEDSSSNDNLLPILDYSQRKQDQSLPSCVSNQKSSEDRKMDTFLDDAHKKSVSNGIRQCNRE
ncbi:hypothetical protein C1645_841243 [Glomus cerebriforme]|uniref:Uncharacterized protein n=1 Tax=Glomus cerebriforme TaxID=658196 RepID=A0A397S0Z3_9GLOM|nr:hypothetical protein C1645_841243 [Glomus cerebriforme]